MQKDNRKLYERPRHQAKKESTKPSEPTLAVYAGKLNTLISDLISRSIKSYDRINILPDLRQCCAEIDQYAWQYHYSNNQEYKEKYFDKASNAYHRLRIMIHSLFYEDIDKHIKINKGEILSKLGNIIGTMDESFCKWQSYVEDSGIRLKEKESKNK